MRHPSTRAERRDVWFLSRQRYRRRLKLYFWFGGTKPEQHITWNRGGKQCEAHGNRCAHSLIDRHERRIEIKKFRRISIELDRF